MAVATILATLADSDSVVQPPIKGRYWVCALFDLWTVEGTSKSHTETFRLVFQSESRTQCARKFKNLKRDFGYRFEVKLDRKQKGRMPGGELLGPIKVARLTRDLWELQQRSTKAKSIKDPIFGTLKATGRGIGSFEGKAVLLDKKVKCSISMDKPQKDPSSPDLSHHHKQYQRLVKDYPKLLGKAVTEMYPLWDTTWRQDDKKVTKTAFAEKMKPSSIEISEGSCTIYFAIPEYFFGGHWIEVFRSGGKVYVDLIG